jgi:hypothetical protein
LSWKPLGFDGNRRPWRFFAATDMQFTSAHLDWRSGGAFCGAHGATRASHRHMLAFSIAQTTRMPVVVPNFAWRTLRGDQPNNDC